MRTFTVWYKSRNTTAKTTTVRSVRVEAPNLERAQLVVAVRSDFRGLVFAMAAK